MRRRTIVILVPSRRADQCRERGRAYSKHRSGALSVPARHCHCSDWYWMTTDRHETTSARHHLEAARGAGVNGSFLSGAGPTVLAICSGTIDDICTQRSGERQERAVAAKMRMAADVLDDKHAAWKGGEFFIACSPTTRGAHVAEAQS